MEHLLSAAALQAKRAKAKLSEDDDASNGVDKKEAESSGLLSKNVRICLKLLNRCFRSFTLISNGLKLRVHTFAMQCSASRSF